MPPSDANPVLAAILADAQQLQRNEMTRESLKQLVDLQRQEFLTMVRAEKEPLHAAISKIHSDVSTVARNHFQIGERVNTLESRMNL